MPRYAAVRGAEKTAREERAAAVAAAVAVVENDLGPARREAEAAVEAARERVTRWGCSS